MQISISYITNKQYYTEHHNTSEQLMLYTDNIA